MLFDMGCGFTEFLSNVFAHLPLPQVGFHLQYLFSDLIISESQIKTIGQVLQCRLVCSTWRDFIDMEVRKPNSFLRQSHNEQDFVETISQRTRLLPRLSSGTQTPWESDCGELGLWIIVCSTVVARCQPIYRWWCNWRYGLDTFLHIWLSLTNHQKQDQSGDDTIFKKESDKQLSGGYCCIWLRKSIRCHETWRGLSSWPDVSI